MLGVAMEAALLLLSFALGIVPEFGVALADFASGVSWAILVCVGVSAAVGFSKGFLPLAGAVGFLAAPASFEAARIVHAGSVEAFVASGVGAGEGYPVMVAAVKGAEYAFLALAVGWVGRRPWGGAMAHAAAGLVAGTLFGGMLAFIAAGGAASGATVFTLGVNEFLFPVGCAMVLFLADMFEGRAKNHSFE